MRKAASDVALPAAITAIVAAAERTEMSWARDPPRFGNKARGGRAGSAPIAPASEPIRRHPDRQRAMMRPCLTSDPNTLPDGPALVCAHTVERDARSEVAAGQTGTSPAWPTLSTHSGAPPAPRPVSLTRRGCLLHHTAIGLFGILGAPNAHP